MLSKPNKVPKHTNVAVQMYVYDPDIGFWGARNCEKLVYGQYRDQPIQVYHNSDGLREDDNIQIDNQGSIIAIGGSHTWGGGIDKKARYSDRLRALLGHPVINMGHPSLGLDQVCLAIFKKSLKYNPKIIVVEQYTWALHRILRSHVNGFPKPVFRLSDSGKIKLKKPGRWANVSLFRRIHSSYLDFLNDYNTISSQSGLLIPNDPLEDPIFQHWKNFYYDYMYSLSFKLLLILRDFCSSNGIKLIFALGALRQQIQGSPQSDLVDFSLPLWKFKSQLDSLGISHVDISTSLIEKHSEKTPVIFSDGHINELGNEIFAMTIAERIEHEKLLK